MELTKEHFDSVVTTLATKEEISGLVTKNDLDSVVADLVTKTDLDNAVSSLATKSELTSVTMDLLELKEIVVRLDKRDKEDSDMFKTMFLDHDIRLTRLETLAKVK